MDAPVDVGVVDDLPGEEDAPVRELLARLVGILHCAIYSVAEAELTRQLEAHVASAGGIVQLLDTVNDLAVVALFEQRRDRLAELEAALEVRLAHQSSIGEPRAIGNHPDRAAAQQSRVLYSRPP